MMEITVKKDTLDVSKFFWKTTKSYSSVSDPLGSVMIVRIDWEYCNTPI